MRKIVSSPYKKSIPTTYGVMVVARDTGRWLMMKRKHSISLTTLLRGRFSLSHTPEIVSKLTNDECDIIERILQYGQVEYLKVMETVYGDMIKDKETPWYHFKHASDLIWRSLDKYAEPGYTKPQLPYLWAKGHKLFNTNESDIACAFRELGEESGFTYLPKGSITLDTPVSYSQEGFFGTYSTTCWICIFSNEISIPDVNYDDVEVADRKWISLEDSCNVLSKTEYSALLEASSYLGTTT